MYVLVQYNPNGPVLSVLVKCIPLIEVDSSAPAWSSDDCLYN